MFSILKELNPVLLAFIAGTATFIITSLGSSIVFFFKKTNKTINEAMLGFSAGIMIAASFFSLILPAIEYENINILYPTIIGFILGTVLLYILEKACSKFESKKSLLLLFSITLHNIPEGIATGVGLAGSISNIISIKQAFTLSLAITLHNIPEGIVVALMNSNNKKKAIKYGIISGIVEPISALITTLITHKITFLLLFLSNNFVIK